MKLGIEFNHGFMLEDDTLETVFRRAKAIGAQGGQFKNPMYLSKTLDTVELREVKAMADEIGVYIALGLGRINPYNTSEASSVWQLGGGSYKRGCERIIEAAASIGCHDLVSQTGGWRGYTLPQPFNTDRFREDVSWDDQLEATAKFLKALSPALRACGSTISVETHEEITSHEVLALIERVGADVVSATLDTGNAVARGEDPVAAARRLGPHIRQLHVKDVLLFKTEKGFLRNVRPAGDGVIDFAAIAAILREKSPDALWNIEDHMGEMFIEYKDAFWRSMHPDLSEDEVSELERMAVASAGKIASGAITAPEEYEKISFDRLCMGRIETAIKHLRPILC